MAKVERLKKDKRGPQSDKSDRGLEGRTARVGERLNRMTMMAAAGHHYLSLSQRLFFVQAHRLWDILMPCQGNLS